MSKKRRSLADDLAELFNPAPAPELDPETAGVDLPLLAPADDDFERHAKPTRAAKEKSLRLRGDIQLEDKAYTGRRVSRAEVFGDGASSSGSDHDDADADEDEELEEDESGGASDESAPGSRQGNGLSHSGVSSGEEDEDGGSGESEEEGDENGDGGDSDREEAAAARRASGAEASTSGDEGSGSGSDYEDGGCPAAGGKEAQRLEEEYRQLQEVERSALEGLKERAQKERQKGRAVAAQQRLYERALEARILLQKCVAAGNVLPRAGAELQSTLACSESLRSSYSLLRSEAHDTLTTLLDLHAALVANNPAIPQAAAAVPPTTAAANGTPTSNPPATRPGHKRSRHAAGIDTLEIAWQALEGQFAAVAAYRDASLDRWHRRTMLASGSAALKGGGLRALHQSVSAQVANMVRDNAKAVKRTRLTLTSRPRILCALSAADPTTAPPSRDGHSASEAQEAGGEEPQDPETFDDAEFYQQLLKELIDFSAAAAGGAGGPGYKGQKKRKNVDRRASKGRKIRYHVHEKLVNFAVPVEAELPVFAGQLFSNLFGRAKA